MKWEKAMIVEPIKVNAFSLKSPRMFGPRSAARNRRTKPHAPDKRTKDILWFLYPEINAYKLTGTTNINNSWCTRTLSNEMARNPVLRIKKEGTKRQCRAHTKDSAIANLSEFNWVFMVLKKLDSIGDAH